MWTILAPIIAKYGVEFAYNLWGNIKAGGDPTEEQWATLRELAKKTASDYLKEAEAKASPPTPPSPA